MSCCYNCSRELIGDEIALHKRLIGKGENKFMCLSCLADFFECDEELLKKKIEYFRNTGCLLFGSPDK